MIRSIIASLLVVSSAYAQFEIDVPAPGQQSTSLNGSTFDNCAQITPFYNLHWTVNGTDLVVVHEGTADNVADVYFAWAVVADQNAPNRMAGSDAIITSFDGATAVAEDYLMTAVAVCNTATGLGVCPDEISGVGLAGANPALNSVSNVAGFMQDGIHVVRYTRSLLAADATDLPVDINVDVNYIFARGPVMANGLAGFHADGSRTAVSINFGRAPSSDCTQLSPVVAATTTRGPLTTTRPTTRPTTISNPQPTDSGASAAKPELVLAALVMGAALL